MNLLCHDVGSVLEVIMRSRKEVERKETEFLVKFAKSCHLSLGLERQDKTSGSDKWMSGAQVPGLGVEFQDEFSGSGKTLPGAQAPVLCTSLTCFSF